MAITLTASEQKAVDNLIDKLGLSIAEAVDVIQKDKIIDKGGRTEFDLSKEQEKQAKKFANAGTRKTPVAYKWNTADKPKTKANPTKEGIISIIAESLKNCGLEIENLEIPNKGKLITFTLGGNNFKLDLVQQRAKKGG